MDRMKNKKRLVTKLKNIIGADDIGKDSLIVRRMSQKHCDELDVLIENISILVTYLKFDLMSTKKELSDIKKIIEKNQ